MTPNRYAIYVVPDRKDPWAQLCTKWLGWDVETGQAVPHPDLGPAIGAISAITAVPRRYGLHATIKPPFRLRTGRTPAALRRSVSELAAQIAPITVDTLVLTRLGRFLALTAASDTSALNTSAARVVKELDMFRAPPCAQELARRRAATLSPAQEANLQTWGYPHVMDQFRFHITLTGKLPRDELANTEAALQVHLSPLLPAPFVIRDLALVAEDDDGFFHLLDRMPLSGV